MGRPAEPDSADSRSTENTPRAPRASAERKPRTPRESEGHSSGKYALARRPLGIVLAALFLVEAVMGLVVRSNLPPAATIFVVCAMVVLAFGVFACFFYVWIRNPGSFYSPTDFRDDEAWHRAQRSDLRPSEPILPLPPPKPVQAAVEVRPGAGFVPAPPDLTAPALSQDPDAWITGDLSGGEVTSTLIMDLSRHLKGKSDWGFLTVDTDRVWLLSRLFIFVSLYRVLRPLPCIVFIQWEGTMQKLLGVADSAKVCSSIARLHSHFNHTLAAILTERNIPIFMSGAIDESSATKVMEDFVHRLQSQDDHSGDPEWSKLNPITWEHTRWLEPQMVRTDLSGAISDPGASVFHPTQGISDKDFVFEVMKRDSRFVATVGDRGEFLQLYDKYRIFDEFRNRLEQPVR